MHGKTPLRQLRRTHQQPGNRAGSIAGSVSTAAAMLANPQRIKPSKRAVRSSPDGRRLGVSRGGELGLDHG